MSRPIENIVRQKLISEHALIFTKDKIEEQDLRDAISNILSNMQDASLSEDEKKAIINKMISEFVGFGPIDSLMKDSDVTEIMINGPKKIYVERHGKKELSKIVFDDEEQLMSIVRKLLAPTRRRVDETFPYTEISLKDGSRINIIIPPLALDGPIVTIRKYLRELGTVEDLIGMHTLDKRMGEFLVACIKAKANLIFCGATGVGKTTTLGVLSGYISNDERIITIEDTAELRLNQDHVVRLETKPQSIEGKGEISVRELFKNSLRMRPQRIILGEIRGAEVLDMLQAIFSGHTGALSVIHANSPENVVYRIENMIALSGLPLALEVIHRQIAAAIDIIVTQDQLLDGTRRITRISQTNGIKDGQVLIDDIFCFEQAGINSEGKITGKWVATGIIPKIDFKKLGIQLNQEIFRKG